MNSSAHPTSIAASGGSINIRAASRHRIGRSRLPPAKTLYRIAWCREVGAVSALGSNRSSPASITWRSASKKSGSVTGGIIQSVGCCGISARTRASTSRFRPSPGGGGPLRSLILGRKRFGHYFSVGLLQQNFHAPFRFFQLFLAFLRKFHALFEQLHRVVQREVRVLEPLHHFFQPPQRSLEIAFLRRLWHFIYSRIHRNLLSNSTLTAASAPEPSISTRSQSVAVPPVR